MRNCINIREKFGQKYHVCFEESQAADRGIGREESAWLMIIPCRHGHLYPYGGVLLAASVDGHPYVAAELRRLKCCQVVQDGDFGELTVTFDVGDLGAVAKIMRPRQRRQMSLTEEQRQAIGDRLKAGREGAAKPIAGSESTAQGTHEEARDDMGDLSGE